MANKAYQPFAASIWLILYLAVNLLTACSLGETPATVGPIVTESTTAPAGTTVAATVGFTPATSPPATATPGRTATPAPTTPAPDSFSHKGDTLVSRSPIASPTPRVASADVVIPCVVGPASLQLRSGPDTNYASIRTLAAGTSLSALKYYDAHGLWLLVETRPREAGWVYAAAVSCQGVLSGLPLAEGVGVPPPSASPLAAVPTSLPGPTASPTLATLSLSGWRGEYYDNPDLAGEPVLVRDDPALDFNWGSAGPGPDIPADHFSVRWTRPFEFAEEGDYRFLADVDDGVKLYLDGWLIIDEWNTNPYVLHSGAFGDIKPGVHTITVEYFEAEGEAHINVWFEKTIVSADKWVGEYYNNPDFRDAPFLIREDDDLDFDWGDDEPVPGMNDDNFSVRWQRTVVLKAGDYDFRAHLAEEDRVKIYLDSWLIIEEDSDNGGAVEGSFNDVGAGTHTIKVEFQDYGGDAGIEVDWDIND